MSALQDFWESAAELRKFWQWIVLSAALPFMAQLAKFAPPWPPAISVLTSIVAMLALVSSYQFLKSASRRTANRVIAWSIVLLFLMSIVYIGLLSQLVFQTPSGELRIKGLVCTQMAQQAYPARCPWLDDFELKQSAWSPEFLWQSWSITLARIALVSSWLGSFLLLSAAFASFIVYQKRPKPQTRNRETMPS